jgi:hypothetical protein
MIIVLIFTQIGAISAQHSSPRHTSLIVSMQNESISH